MYPGNGPVKLTTPSLPVCDRDRIRRALIAGEQSGEPQSFDFEAFRKRKTKQFS